MDGVLNVLKPPGMTSSDVVVDIRRLLGEKRVGHTGTLDPGAAGVLPVCVGRATRLFDYLVDKHKTYIAEITFGMETDTQDSYGSPVKSYPCNVTAAELKAVLRGFTCKMDQVVPMYSAVKVGGRKMYELARKDMQAEQRARQVEIFSLELLEQTATNRFLLQTCCSKGTYIRTLCYDIGKRLGTGAHMSFLLRTASGAFILDEAKTIKEFAELKERGNLIESITPMDEAISFLPSVYVDSCWRSRIVNGNPVSMDMLKSRVPAETSVRVYCGGFIGIGKADKDSLFISTMLAT